MHRMDRIAGMGMGRGWGDRLGCGWAGIGRDGDGPDGQDSWDGKGPG